MPTDDLRLAVYESVRDRMETGDLLLWKTHSLLGSVIRLLSRGAVNHASLVIRLQEYEGVDRRRFTTEALEHGIVLSLLSGRLRGYHGTVWWLPLKPEFDGSRKEIGQRAFSWLGTPYDYPSLFANAITHVKAEPSALFCSEYCFLCYGLAGKAPTPAELPSLGLFCDPIVIYDYTGDYMVGESELPPEWR